MNKKIKITCAIIIAAMILFLGRCAYAATASLTASTTEAKVGDTITLSANVNAAQWKLQINNNGSMMANSMELDNYKSNISKSFSGQFTPTAAGTYTFTLTGDITDVDTTNQIINKSVTVTVNEPAKQEPEPTNTTPANTTPEGNETPTNQTPTNQVPPQQQKQEPEATYQAVNDTIYSSNGTINIRSGPSISYSIVGSLAKGQPLTRTGIGSNGWDKVSLNGSIAYINHALITTTKPEEEPKVEEKSTNKSLKELKVEGYDIDPIFNPEITKYTINLKEDETEDSLKLTATAENEKASVNIEGNENFTPGNNIVKITVTAEDGTARIYTITVVKSSKIISGDELRLSTLEIANATIEPAFSPEITNYIIHIEDPSSIKAQNFVATPADADVVVTKAENNLSENGEKVIVFMLQSKDGSKNGTYQITVKKPAAKVESMVKEDNDKTIYYILGGTIGVLVILIIIIIIALKKTADADNEDDEDYNDEEDSYNNTESNYTSNNYDYSLKNAIDEANTDIEEDSSQDNNFKFTSQPLNKKVKNFDLEEDNDEQESSIEETRTFKFEPNNAEDNDNIDFTEKKKGKHF